MNRTAFYLLLMIFASPALWATGIGVYGTSGVGSTTWNYQRLGTSVLTSLIDNGISYKSTDYFYGGGIVIDTAVAEDRLFNYRFTAGYELFCIKYPGSIFTENPIDRFSMSHTFGFGLLRNQNVRLWIGPRLGFHYLYINTYVPVSLKDVFNFPSRILIGNPLKNKIKIDIAEFGFDILLALGLNINIGNYTTLFVDIGGGYMGNYDLKIAGAGHAIVIDGRVGIMFRVNDSFLSPSGVVSVPLPSRLSSL